MSADVRPFRIEISDEQVADLHDRLARTRWVDQLPGGRDRGVPVDRLREWAERWRTQYDWRAHEARLNAFDQVVTEIDGVDVHAVHVRSPEPGAVPLVLTHGWPNSFVEFAREIGPLTDPRAHGLDPAVAFDVVVPSVPGFGFSGAPRETGWSAERVAGAWVELMDRLGYDRFGVQGGDLGTYVSVEAARLAPDRVVGVHVDGGLGFVDDDELDTLSPEDREEYQGYMQWAGAGVDHHAILRAAPQTFAHAWNDSPTGLLAWMLQKFGEFAITVDLPEQAIDPDDILTTASVYWFTGTAASSSWFMYESDRFRWPRGQKAVPSGEYGGGPDVFRRIAERRNDVVHWPEGNPGGHFVAMEEPTAHVADIRTFFGSLVA